MNPAASKHTDRNVCLDGIRGIAVGLVIVTHAFDKVSANTTAEAALLSLAKSAWVGVDLFFVLSGFLITGILIRSRVNAPAIYFRTFYMRRVFRIFPLYYVFLGMFVLALAFQSKPLERLALQWNLPYLSNVYTALYAWAWRPLNHLWSLSVEEQFYLIWPAIVFIVPPQRMFASVAAILCTFLVIRQFCVMGGMTPLAVYTTLHLDGLLLGAALAVTGQPRNTGRAAPIAWSFLLFFTALLLPQCLGPSGLDTLHWRGGYVFNYTLIAAWGVSLISVSLYSAQSSWINRAVSFRPFVELGKYSYAIYLFHLPIDSACRSLHLHPASIGGTIGYTIILTLVSFGCALVSWKILEERCIRLKDRWFSYPARRSGSGTILN